MDETIIERHDPADAFGALSDPIRVEILRALWDTDDQTATFSELYDRVDVSDSGQFNYHLDKLAGQFVRKADDGGYELALAGRHVVGSLLQGAYARTEQIDPIPLDVPCPFCGGDRTFHYEDETVRMVCADCPAEARFEVAPGVFSGHEREAFPSVARRYLRVMLHEASNGFCPYCEGQFQPTVEADCCGSTGAEALPMCRYDCARCGETMVTDPGTALLFEPAVIAFFADHGVDIREEPLARFIPDAEDVTVRQEEPPRVVVTYTADGDRLELVVDDSLTVEERRE